MRKIWNMFLIGICCACVLISGAILMSYVPSVDTDSPESLSGENAKDIAKTYIEISPYSRNGLIEELVSREKIDVRKARKTVNNLNLNFEKQALRSAKMLTQNVGYSKVKLHEELENEGFTESEIQYVDLHDFDYEEQALKKARTYFFLGIGTVLQTKKSSTQSIRYSNSR